MTPQDVPGGGPTREDLKEIMGRLDDLENERVAIKSLPDAVARLAGQVEVLIDLVTGGNAKLEKATSFKSAIAFASVVIIPVLVAIIGGYFALKAAGAAGTK